MLLTKLLREREKKISIRNGRSEVISQEKILIKKVEKLRSQKLIIKTSLF